MSLRRTLGLTETKADDVVERAYRRGYQHGVRAALDAIRARHTQSEIDDWLARIESWRHKCGPTAMPPIP